MQVVATVKTAAISQNCCGETAASIWGDVSVCLSQHSSLQAFQHHVVFCLSSPSPFLHPLLSLVIFQSRHPSLPPPHPPLIALSGHPPCLFRWNRRGNESQSPPLTHSWDFALLLCAFLLFCTLVHSVLLIVICITRRESLCCFFFVVPFGKK